MCMCAQKGQSEEDGPSRPGAPALLQLWHQILLEETWFTQSLLIHKMTPTNSKGLMEIPSSVSLSAKFFMLSLQHSFLKRPRWMGISLFYQGRKEDESHSAQGSPMHFTTLICSLPIFQYRWEDGKEQHEVIWTHQMEQEISLNCSWGIYLGCRFPWQDSTYCHVSYQARGTAHIRLSLQILFFWGHVLI